MFQGILRLKNLNYYPDLILDIGAYHGNWTKDCLNIYNNSDYILFEAINYNELNRFNNHKKIHVYNELLFSCVTEVDWYEMRNTGDSIFKELNKPFENCNPVKRLTNTLNNILNNNEIVEKAKNIFIKIDCQGAEIPILQGADNNLFNKTDFIILELPFFGKYNNGVSTFAEHINYMDSIGFIPFDMLENHYINGFNMQVDMMFINKKHEFISLVQNKLLI
jgi:FkbM family methyltransferase